MSAPARYVAAALLVLGALASSGAQAQGDPSRAFLQSKLGYPLIEAAPCEFKMGGWILSFAAADLDPRPRDIGSDAATFACKDGAKCYKDVSHRPNRSWADQSTDAWTFRTTDRGGGRRIAQALTEVIAGCSAVQVPK